MTDHREIDLTVYAGRIWRNKFHVLLVALVCGAVGAVAAALAPGEYVCRSIVLVEQVNLGTVNVARNERAITTDTFLHFFTNDHNLKNVIEKCGLAEACGIYTPKDLRSRVKAQTGRNTSLIEVTVSMPTADLAYEVAEKVVTNATRTSKGVMERNVEMSRRMIEQELARLRAESDEMDRRFLAHQEQTRLETALQRFGQSEIERRTLREDLGTSLAEMAEKRRQWEILTAAAEPLSPTRVMTKAVIEEPALLDLLEKTQGETGFAELTGIRLESEVDDFIYTKIAGMIVDVTSAYEGNRARAEELGRILAELEEETAELERRYQYERIRSTRLQRERDAAHHSFSEMINTYARIANEVFWDQQRLSLLVPPTPPMEASRPSMSLVAFGSSFLGFVAAAVVVSTGKNGYRGSAPRRCDGRRC